MITNRLITTGIIAAQAFAGSVAAFAQTSSIDRATELYENYNLTEAQKLLNVAKAKAKKGTAELEDINELSHRINTARNFLERVEHIKIIDSIAVGKSDFFKAYRLPGSAGYLGDVTSMPYGGNEISDTDYVFTNEGGDYKIWAEPDSAGFLTLAEATRLTDGSWTSPQVLEDLAEEYTDVAFPFMMPDGVTLYFASKSSDGLGGYDIMVASRDAADGTFLQPQNLGMPYNSPYDDYLLAIDELNGVGWFASDRNRLGDDITIYVFKVNDMRQNYDSETDDLVDRAMLRDWRLTHDEEDDFSELLDIIRAIDPEAESKKEDFRLPMDNGVVYTTYMDFSSSSASAMMEKYMNDKKEYESISDRLKELRREYHTSPTENLGRTIKQLEQQITGRKENLRRQLSDIYRTERQKR